MPASSNLLSGAPPCSRFMFDAYIAPDRQDAVIADLEATKPEIILWSAPDWWANIDGHAFPDRSPAPSRMDRTELPRSHRNWSLHASLSRRSRPNPLSAIS